MIGAIRSSFSGLLEGAFQGYSVDEYVDLHKAEEYIHRALTDGTFDFRREPTQLKPPSGLSENEGKVAGPPVETGIVARWNDMVVSVEDLRLAGAAVEYDKRNRTRRFVEFVASDIRRHSVLRELSGEALQELDNQQLREYLKETLNLPDYTAVADSFDGDFQTSVFVFDAPTTLLRVYGGVSSPVGRYVFLLPMDRRDCQRSSSDEPQEVVGCERPRDASWKSCRSSGGGDDSAWN